MKIGIIGGTGYYKWKGEEIKIETSYGEIIAFYFKKYGKDVFFIPRHGKKHKPAHLANYHGNIDAMGRIGVEVILAINTVGSMKRNIKPGSLFIPNDFIDFTKRKCTFYDDVTIHIDMSKPFCPIVRNLLLKEAKKKSIVKEGIYVATEGPRLETRAEIKMLSNFADVVGMTLVPEVILAREKGICYASICLVSNYAAGLQEKLDIDEIKRITNEKKKDILEIIEACIKKMPEKRNCECKYAVEKGRL